MLVFCLDSRLSGNDRIGHLLVMKYALSRICIGGVRQGLCPHYSMVFWWNSLLLATQIYVHPQAIAGARHKCFWHTQAGAHPAMSLGCYYSVFSAYYYPRFCRALRFTISIISCCLPAFFLRYIKCFMDTTGIIISFILIRAISSANRLKFIGSFIKTSMVLRYSD